MGATDASHGPARYHRTVKTTSYQKGLFENNCTCPQNLPQNNVNSQLVELIAAVAAVRSGLVTGPWMLFSISQKGLHQEDISPAKF